MRKFSFFFSAAMIAFLAAYSMAGASRADAAVPHYLTAKVEKACQECRVHGWTAPAQIDEAALRQLLDAPCDRVKGQAIYTLGEIRDQDSVDRLVAMLDQQNHRIRRGAVHALGKIGDHRAVSPLVRVMNNPGEQILLRCTAARALGRIGGSNSVQALRKATHCPEPNLARSATQALDGMNEFLYLGSR